MPETVPTPENTPLPGGGSWHWDDSVPGWVANAAYAPPAPTLSTDPVLE